MKKKICLCVIMLTMFILVLTGCHGSKGLPAFEVPESFDTSRNYEITFWAKNDTNKSQTEIYKKAITDFEALYPNIKVNMKLYTDYNRIYNDVITNIATQTTPNVCITYPDHIATYMTGINIVAPLDELMTDEKYGLNGSQINFDAPTREEIVPNFLSECYLSGSCYALPYMRSTEALYINKELVEKLGYEIPDVLTWDFIFEVSEKAMEKNADGTYKVNGQNVLIPFIYKSTDNMMITMLKQLNAGYSTDEGKIEIFNDTTRQILLNLAPHARSGAFSTFKISSYPGNFLNAGQCIFALDSTAGATWMGTEAPNSDIAEDSEVDFEIVVRPVPQFDVDNPKMMSQGPSVCIFNKEDPQEVLASWIFTQYLLSNEVQIAYAQTEGYVPVTLKAQNSPEYQEYLSLEGSDNDLHYQVKLDATKLLLNNTKNTFVTPVFNGSASLRSAAEALIENTTKSERRGTVVDDSVIDQIFSDVNSLYKLDRIDASSMEKKDLGSLPSASVWLLVSLGLAWVLIGAYIIKNYINRQKRGGD